MNETTSFSVSAYENSRALPLTPDLDLDQVFHKVRRRKRLIFISIGIAMALAAIGSLALTSRFTATAEVLVADRRSSVVDNLGDALQGMPTTDVAHMSSQVQVIKSRNVASSVIDTLDLAQDKEFNAALNPPSLAQRLVDMLPLDELRSMLGLEKRKLSDAAAKAIERQAVIDRFLKNVSAQIVEASRVIKIQFSSTDPEKAARIANAIAEAYINQQLQAQYEALRRTNSWLSGRVDALRKEVKDADQAVENFRSQNGLLEGAGGGRLIEQQISELSSQLMLARARGAESQARLSQIKNLADSDALASLAEVVNSPLISALITQEAEVKRRLAQMSQEFGNKHPAFINAKAELADLRAKITVEVERIVQSLHNEIGVARARELSLQRGLEQTSSRMSKLNADEVTLKALERDAGAARGTLETFLQQAHHLTGQDTLKGQPDVTLISLAPIPVEPSFPPRALMVGLAAVVAGVLTIVSIIIIESMDASFRSSEQLEKAFGIPVLSLTPEIERSRHQKGKVPRYALEQPTSSFADAIRRIHTKLLAEPGVGAIQLTSAEPSVGKTTIALNLAQVNARGGRRVLIIDADFRRSNMGELLQLQKSPGLVDVLTGHATLKEAIQNDMSGTDVLVSGRYEPSVSEMLVLRNLPPLLDMVRRQYDLIILDTPPVMSLVDAMVVAGLVDRTILVVQWARTPKAVVSHAVNEVRAAGGTLGGLILSRVDLEKHAMYSFGDSGQYHGKHKHYYNIA